MHCGTLVKSSGEHRKRRKHFFFFEHKKYSRLHLADAFIQSDLQCIQAIHLYCQYVCSLGIEPTTFALLTQCSNHWATGTCSFITLWLNRWCHMDYFNDDLTTFLGQNVLVVLLSMESQKALGFHQKYLNLCSEDEWRSYGFETT